MARILHIETTTNICSVCLSQDGAVVAQAETAEPNVHAKVITLQIERCLKEAGWRMGRLEAVSVSQGPGSYTGLRVGTSAAKGVCYAMGIPLIGVDTLEALAWACKERDSSGDLYCPMIDARRMEVYLAIYEQAMVVQEAVQARILQADSFDAYLNRSKRMIFCGNGAEKCSKIIDSEYAFFSDVRCSSVHLLAPAERAFEKRDFADLAYFEPSYVKSPYITRPKPRL